MTITLHLPPGLGPVYLRAWRRIFRNRYLANAAMGAGLLGLAYLLTTRNEMMTVTCVVLGLYLLASPFLHVGTLRRHVLDPLDEPCTVTITDERISFVSPSQSSEMKLALVTRVVETRDVFILWRGRRGVNFLVKSEFKEPDLVRFRDILRAHELASA